MGRPDQRMHQESSYILQSGQALGGLAPSGRKEESRGVSIDFSFTEDKTGTNCFRWVARGLCVARA